MPRHRTPLPERLPEAFSVADAGWFGISRHRLRGSDLQHPFRGGRLVCPPSAAGDQVGPDSDLPPWEHQRREHLRRVQAYLPLLGSRAYFCGPTAALVWGLPLPPGDWSTLHVGVPRPLRSPRRPGIVGHMHTAGFVGIAERDGLPLTDPASTWATLGGILTEDDLTVIADQLLRVPRMPGGFRATTEGPIARREQLELLAERKGRPGAPRLRRALAEARTGASSPPETRIRLLIRDVHLPEPVLDYDVYDRYGRFLGCSELAYPERRIAIEYESDGHLSQRQLRRDIDKYQLYAEAGWQVVRLTSEHVFRAPSEAIRRIRHALRTAPR